MNIERLLKTADLLDEVAGLRSPKIDFMMSTWGSYVDGYDPKTVACRTAACAVGHAALRPWFQKEGLFLAYNDHDQTIGGQADAWHNVILTSPAEFLHAIYSNPDRDMFPIYDGETANNAVGAFYDIPQIDVVNLFGPANSNDPFDVAAKIRNYVGRHLEVPKFNMPRRDLPETVLVESYA